MSCSEDGIGDGGYARLLRIRSITSACTPQSRITKKGTIIYRAGCSAVRDDGKCLAVSSQVDRAGVTAALRLAMERYGERVIVSGSARRPAH
jgi:hypothetical protein